MNPLILTQHQHNEPFEALPRTNVNMKQIVLSLFLICLFCTPGHTEDLLKLVSSTWPPYVDEKLPHKGLAMHIVTEAFTRAGYRTSLVSESWPRSLQGVEIGVYDVIATAWYTDERARKFTFSQPYLFNEIRFIKRKQDPFTYDGLLSLTGMTVGIVYKYAYGEEFERATNFTKVPGNHVIQNLLKLTQGQIDLTLGDERTLRHELKEYLSTSMASLEFLPKPLATKGLYVAVSKTNPDHDRIAAAFDKAIVEMKDDGTYEAILRQHGN